MGCGVSQPVNTVVVPTTQLNDPNISANWYPTPNPSPASNDLTSKESSFSLPPYSKSAPTNRRSSIYDELSSDNFYHDDYDHDDLSTHSKLSSTGYTTARYPPVEIDQVKNSQNGIKLAKNGTVLLKADGRLDSAQFRRAAHTTANGAKVTVMLSRDGSHLTVESQDKPPQPPQCSPNVQKNLSDNGSPYVTDIGMVHVTSVCRSAPAGGRTVWQENNRRQFTNNSEV